MIRAARASNAATRIIFLTAYRTPSVDEKAHAFGADVLLQKPRPLPELAQTVMALLGVQECGGKAAALGTGPVP